LLYKEVEYVGQGNDSGKAMNYLESLSPNIKCMRHPNKFLGGSTAILWSHHEKLVVVDRNLAFVGGIDLAYQRWDDEQHRVCDEDGVFFPGGDYRQPATGLFKPCKVPFVAPGSQPAADDGAGGPEVEVHQPRESLPVAAAALMDADDTPVEIQVESVVDFGVQSDERLSHHNAEHMVASSYDEHQGQEVHMMPTEANMAYAAAAANADASLGPGSGSPLDDDDNRSCADTAEERLAKLAINPRSPHSPGDDDSNIGGMGALDSSPSPDPSPSFSGKKTIMDDFKAAGRGMNRVASGLKVKAAKLKEKANSPKPAVAQPVETREAYPRM
jgi:hypothetical protein